MKDKSYTGRTNENHLPGKNGRAHSHNHSHGRRYALPSVGKALIIGIIINLLFVAVEFAAGFYYNSMALMSDAGHNLSDVVSLILALLAYRLAKVKASDCYTFGYRKSTILVSLLNAVMLIVIAAGIIWESINKLGSPQPVAGGAMAWVAGIGVLINGFTALLFIREKDRDLNVKGAYLHMIADAMVSVGVLLAGLIIAFTGWYILDPIVGITVAVIILFSTWGLLRESIRLSMDGVPLGMNRNKINEAITGTNGVSRVHHIHIWAISTTETALTAHIISDGSRPESEIKAEIKEKLAGYGICHTTLEFETAEEDCPECSMRN